MEPADKLEELFNPDLATIRQHWPGAQTIPLSELPDKLFE